jgi:CheY-like chemotaxis protein
MKIMGAGFDVIEAKCGAEALERLRQSHSDLALFDWNMPIEAPS